MSRLKLIRLLGLATLLGMPLLAWIISLIFDLDFNLKKWFTPENWALQVSLGVSYGLLIGIIASWISERKFMDKVRSRYARILTGLKLTWFDVFFISICAGVGEEILFRFALQSLTGIWIAAIIFVAIHGYLNYKDWALSVYGGFMVFASAGFGFMAMKWGLLSAMIAHAAVDIYLLAQVKRESSKNVKISYPEEIENDSNPED